MQDPCQFIKSCVLFAKTLKDLPEIALLMEARHCQRDHEGCGLYHMASALGPENVPEGLFPNQTGRAEQLIQEYGKKELSQKRENFRTA